MSMQFKQVSHEIKELDDAKGVVIAYASVYNNIDADREVIMPGAFTKTVNENIDYPDNGTNKTRQGEPTNNNLARN